MLEEYPDDIDKSENSPVYNAVAGQAAEMSQLYTFLEVALQLAFADTSEGEYLTRRVAEFGTNRRAARKAIKKGIFKDDDDSLIDIPIGSRFFIDDLHYEAIEKISEGSYQLQCEEEGTVGNRPKGDLLPIENINSLATAEMTDVIVSGEDEESDESLFERYIHDMNEPAFGGNVSDYKGKINSIQGVGGVEVIRAWNGGGTVKCIIIASDFSKPSDELIDSIQTEIDPEENQGEGIGLAPIGHIVTISPVAETEISIETTVTLDPGLSASSMKEDIEASLSDYLLSLRKAWKDEDKLVVRTAQIDARLLMLPSVVDIAGTKINGLKENVEINKENIPVLGAVTVNE